MKNKICQCSRISLRLGWNNYYLHSSSFCSFDTYPVEPSKKKKEMKKLEELTQHVKITLKQLQCQFMKAMS